MLSGRRLDLDACKTSNRKAQGDKVATVGSSSHDSHMIVTLVYCNCRQR